MRLPPPDRMPLLRVVWPVVSSQTRILWCIGVFCALAFVAQFVPSSASGGPPTLPLGHDFLSFYAAGHLAFLGHPLDAYDAARHWAEQTAVFGVRHGRLAFFYPPMFLLLCLPLGALSYYAALAVWVVGGLAAYAASLRAYLPRDMWLLASLAFPGVLLSIAFGQNSFLTTALLATTFAALDRRPLLAGFVCGLLCYKPHLALAVPIVLLVQGRWHAILGGFLAVTTLAGLTTLAFGPAIWAAYGVQLAASGESLGNGSIDYKLFVSIFAALRVADLAVGTAYAAQIASALAAIAGLVFAARRCRDTQLLGGLAVLTTLLCTPFVLEYDLLMLAIPMARLYTLGRAGGFARGETSALAAIFIAPLAILLGIPGWLLGPTAVIALYTILLRRAVANEDARPVDALEEWSMTTTAAARSRSGLGE